MPNTYTQDNTGTPGTQLAHTLSGSPYRGGFQRENAGPGTTLATPWSTAPHQTDEERREYRRKVREAEANLQEKTTNPVGPKGCHGNEGTCGAPGMKMTGFCYGHSRSMGLLEVTTNGDDS